MDRNLQPFDDGQLERFLFLEEHISMEMLSSPDSTSRKEIKEMQFACEALLERVLSVRQQFLEVDGNYLEAVRIADLRKVIFSERAEAWITYANTLKIAGSSPREVISAFRKAIEVSKNDGILVIQSNLEYIYYIMQSGCFDKNEIEACLNRIKKYARRSNSLDIKPDKKLMERIKEMGVDEKLIDEILLIN